MKLLLQRVQSASVLINDDIAGKINKGLLVFIGFEKKDTEQNIAPMVKKLLNYRIFNDAENRMNHNIQQANGELLIVSQFTLAADTKKGLRPGFSTASPPNTALNLYNKFVYTVSQNGISVATGEFGANMQVSSINDGPVTFLLEG